jgi:universal stress protein family protein
VRRSVAPCTQLSASTRSSGAASTVAEDVPGARQPDAAAADLANDGPRVLVVYEPGPFGSRTLDRARELVQGQDGQLTVVTVAPRDTRVRGTGVSARDYNDAVRDSAQRELDQARRLLGPLRIVFEVVVEGGNASVAAWAADGVFDIILLPARRRLFSRGGHPLAAALRGSTAADVRIVARDGATQGG